MTTSKMGFIALAVLCTASLAYGQSQTQTEETLTLTDATARALRATWTSGSTARR